MEDRGNQGVGAHQVCMPSWYYIMHKNKFCKRARKYNGLVEGILRRNR